jgi:hypothetical protein
MVYQTDPEFSVRPNIRPFGCYFLAITEAITSQFGLPFTHESVIKLYDEELCDGDILSETFVKSPQGLIDCIIPGKVTFLGFRTPDYQCKDNEIEWGCWHRTGAGYNHFTHNNGKGIVLYDPWSPEGSNSVSEGFLISKRVARLL